MIPTLIKHHSFSALIAAAALTAIAVGHADPAEARTVAVTNCNDSGTGSLRVAVTRAQSGDLVDMRGLRCTIVLTRGAIKIPQQDLALVGRGAGALTITSQNRSRILSHEGTGTLRIASLSIVDGRRSAESFASGGCIFSDGNVTLQHARVRQCTASGARPPDCEGITCSSDAGGAISARGTVRMTYSTVSDSSTSSYDSYGGGIYADALIMFRSRLLRNSANFAGGAQVLRFVALGSLIADNNDGGGVHVGDMYSHFGSGPADVRDSTFVGNTTDEVCSALCAGDARIVNSTFTNNASYSGFAIELTDGSIVNSTVAGNSEFSTYRPCGGAVGADTLYLESVILAGNACGPGVMDLGGVGSLTGAHNLVGAARIPLPAGTIRSDPLLGPLAFNGGYTPTRALRDGSPAIDNGNNPLNLDYDQRGPGFPRKSGARTDIGAFERQQP